MFQIIHVRWTHVFWAYNALICLWKNYWNRKAINGNLKKTVHLKSNWMTDCPTSFTMNQISPCKTKTSYKITHCLQPYNIHLYTFWVVWMLLYNHLLSVSLTGWLEILGCFHRWPLGKKIWSQQPIPFLKFTNLHNVPLENRPKFQKQILWTASNFLFHPPIFRANLGLYLPGHATLARRFGTGLAVVWCGWSGRPQAVQTNHGTSKFTLH